MSEALSSATIRLAEGNWEGNHGFVEDQNASAWRLAEGNWEGNHGQPDA